MKTASGGDIWKAKRVVIGKDGKERRKVIEAGELVEFRYWSAAHVRTRDGLYLEIPEDEFYYSFEYVGRIFEEVCFRNQNSTAEILDARLYTESSS